MGGRKECIDQTKNKNSLEFVSDSGGSWLTMSNRIKSFVEVFLLALLTILLSLQSASLWNELGTLTDSNVFYYIGNLILRGGIPYRDTFDHKGPLIYLINAFGIGIGGWKGIWLFEFISFFVMSVFLYRIARLVTTRRRSFIVIAFSVAALFGCIEGGNFTEVYALPFLALCLFIFADYMLNDHIAIIRVMICGCSFAAVCMLRVNMAMPWAVLGIATIVLELKKHSIKRLIGFITSFAAGSLVIFLPIVAWLYIKHALVAFVQDYILFNIKYSSFFGEGITGAIRGSAAFFFVNNVLLLIAICSSLYFTYRKKKFFDVTHLLVFMISIVSVSLSGRTYLHYGLVLVPCMIYPLAQLVEALLGHTGQYKKLVKPALLFFVLVWIAPSWLGGMQSALKACAERDRSFIEEKNETGSLARTAAYLRKNTDVEDRVVVCGNYNVIYNLSERECAVKYSYQTAINYVDKKRYDEFVGELKESRPKAIIITPSEIDTQEIMEFIENNHYTERLSDGGFCIYIR